MDPFFASMIDAVNNAVAELEEAKAVEPPKATVTVGNGSVLDPDVARRMRMTQVITKFASTLTLRSIKVMMANSNDNNYQAEAPAWSDSDNIWFNQNTLGDITKPETVLALKGLSLHEIAHILLTPRTGSNLAKDVQRENLWRAFNALEDQRIEMMMTKRFGNVADWLAATVARFLMDEPKQWPYAFSLLHGRKYLPKELRQQVAKLYHQPADVVRIGQLIDQYIGLNLVDPNNYPVALDIIREYNHLVIKDLPPVPDPHATWKNIEGWERISDPSGHDHRKDGEWKSSSSKPMKKSEQDKLAQKVQSDVAGDDTLDDFDSDAQPGATPGDTGDGDGDASESFGKGAGSGSDLRTMADKLVQDVLQRKAKDIANTLKQYNADLELRTGSAVDPERLDTSPHQVEPSAVQASKSFANELERLRADYDPGWLRRTEAGKLNVQRYVTGTDIDECFDEWDIGREDAVDIEAVILLDISGSMQSNAKGAFQSMWAMKRALDKANASTTVIAFDHDTHLLYSSSERADARMRYAWCRGGTDPYESLKYAKNVLAQSTRAIKLCIVITDGVWGRQDDSDNILREFRRAGVLTALAYIEDAYWADSGRDITVDAHGCEVAVAVNEMSDLFTLGRSMVKLGIARNLVSA